MEQPRRYRNPPIEEALCEFRFQPDQDWDLTIPGKLHAKLSDEYAGKPQQQMAVEVGLEAQGGRPSKLKYDEGLARVQLVTENGQRMVGVGPDVLSVHMLRPYSGWTEFQPQISEALNAYWMVAQPTGVSRIGVRYINKIIASQTPVEVESYVSRPRLTRRELFP